MSHLNPSPPILTAHQVQQWRTKGYVVVDGLVDVCTVASYMETRASSTPSEQIVHDFGNDSAMEFPCGVPDVDAVPLHVSYLQAASLLLDVPYVVLHQAVAWSKYEYGGDSSTFNHKQGYSDQRLHQDYGTRG